MPRHTYKTKGTCAVGVSFELTGDIVSDIRFERGCAGNTAGVATLANGMKASELIEKLEGIRCGEKTTSCPAQLAQAVKQALEEAGN